MIFLFSWVILRFHVKCQGCMGKIFKVFSSSSHHCSTTEASSCRPGGHTCGAVPGPLEGGSSARGGWL